MLPKLIDIELILLSINHSIFFRDKRTWPNDKLLFILKVYNVMINYNLSPKLRLLIKIEFNHLNNIVSF
jgi:hypothetical protein